MKGLLSKTNKAKSSFLTPSPYATSNRSGFILREKESLKERNRKRN